MAAQVLLACPTRSAHVAQALDAAGAVAPRAAPKCSCRDYGLGLPQPDCLWEYSTAAFELSRFPLMELVHMPQVSDSGEPNEHSPSALTHIAFPIVLQHRYSRTVISEPDTVRIEDPDLSGCTPLLISLRRTITDRRGIPA